MYYGNVGGGLSVRVFILGCSQSQWNYTVGTLQRPMNGRWSLGPGEQSSGCEVAN